MGVARFLVGTQIWVTVGMTSMAAVLGLGLGGGLQAPVLLAFAGLCWLAYVADRLATPPEDARRIENADEPSRWLLDRRHATSWACAAVALLVVGPLLWRDPGLLGGIAAAALLSWGYVVGARTLRVKRLGLTKQVYVACTIVGTALRGHPNARRAARSPPGPRRGRARRRGGRHRILDPPPRTLRGRPRWRIRHHRRRHARPAAPGDTADFEANVTGSSRGASTQGRPRSRIDRGIAAPIALPPSLVAMARATDSALGSYHSPTSSRASRRVHRRCSMSKPNRPSPP